MKYVIMFLFSLIGSPFVEAKSPDCFGTEQWPSSMTYVLIKNAGFADQNSLDLTKTKTIRIATEMIGKDLYRQVHLITFTKLSGEILQVISINEVSSEECSMSGVDAYVVSQHLGGR